MFFFGNTNNEIYFHLFAYEDYIMVIRVQKVMTVKGVVIVQLDYRMDGCPSEGVSMTQ